MKNYYVLIVLLIATVLSNLVFAVDTGLLATVPLFCQHVVQTALHGANHGGLQLPFCLPNFHQILSTAFSDPHFQTHFLNALDPESITIPDELTVAADLTSATLPADALSIPTEAQLVEGIDSVSGKIGGIWNNWKTSFEAFLDQNPDLKLSSSEYVAKTLKEPTVGYFTDLSSKFNTFLDENPKWQLSTSQFVADFWQTEVVEKSRSAQAVFDESPLATGTKDLLAKLSNLNMKTNIDGAALTLPTVTNEVVNEVAKEVSEKTLSSFNQILDENPKLRLSTSEYVKDYYQTEFLPQWQYFTGVVSQSPLALGTKKFASISTSDFTSDVIAAANQKFGPTLAPVTKPIFSPFVDFFRSTKDVLQATKQSIQSSSEALSDVVAAGSKTGAAVLEQLPTSSEVSLPEISIPEVPLPDVESVLSSASTEVEQKISTLTEQISKVLKEDTAPALNRATVTLGEQLGDAGTVFASRTLSAFSAFGNGISSIVKDAIEIVPSRTNELIASGSTTATELSDTALTNVNDKVSELALNSEALYNQANDVLAKAQQWKFFSDDSHWETGYWEQQYKSLSKLAKELADPDQRQQLIELSQKTLNDAGDRFVAKYQEARSKYQDFDTRVAIATQKLSEASAQLSAATQNALMELKNIDTSEISKIADSVSASTSNIMSDIQKIDTSEVNKIADSVTKDLSSLLDDTRSYVDDFINTNTDI